MSPYIPCIVSDLPKANLPHTMQIGMHDDLPRWIFHLVKTRKWLDQYTAVWLSVPADHDLTPKNKSYEEVSQRNGEEMEQMSWNLLGPVIQYQ